MKIPWYLMAKGKAGVGYKTASGPTVSVNDALAAPLRSLVANVEPVQAGTGDPSPDNVRPISGWSAVNVWLKPTYDPTANPTATIQLGQTVYGGTLDVTNGALTVDAVLEVFNAVGPEGNIISNIGLDFIGSSGSISDLGNVVRVSMTLNSNERSKYNLVSSSYDYKMCNMLRHYFSYNDTTAHWYRNTMLYLFFPKSLVGDTVNSVRDYLISIKDTTPLSLWIPLATPITIPLTPTEISTLQGQNNLWADSGDVTVEYLASGGVDPDLMKLAVAFMGRK